MGEKDIYTAFSYSRNWNLYDTPDGYQEDYINSATSSHIQVNNSGVEICIPLSNIVNKFKPSLDKMIKSITVNKEKRIVTVVFDDKDVKMSKCSENDVFDVNVGVAICVASHLAGSKSKFKSIVEDKQSKRK